MSSLDVTGENNGSAPGPLVSEDLCRIHRASSVVAAVFLRRGEQRRASRFPWPDLFMETVLNVFRRNERAHPGFGFCLLELQESSSIASYFKHLLTPANRLREARKTLPLNQEKGFYGNASSSGSSVTDVL